jgi:hypothetical protein
LAAVAVRTWVKSAEAKPVVETSMAKSFTR